MTLNDRLYNWRRAFKNSMTLHAVWYYTPPRRSDDEDTKLTTDDACLPPIDLADAILLEDAWRRLLRRDYKWYIKHFFITRDAPHAVRRMVRKLNSNVYSTERYEEFQRAALDYFQREIDRK